MQSRGESLDIFAVEVETSFERIRDLIASQREADASGYFTV